MSTTYYPTSISQNNKPLETENTEAPPCIVCEGKRKVVYVCELCKLSVCEVCNHQLHPTEFVMNFHKVKPWIPKTETKEMICSECLDDYCSKHNPETIGLKKAVKQLLQKVALINEKIESLQTLNLKEIDSKKKKQDNLRVHFEKTQKLIIKQTELMQKKIQQIRTSHLEKIQQMQNLCNQNFQKNSERLEQEKKQIDKEKKLIEQIYESKDKDKPQFIIKDSLLLCEEFSNLEKSMKKKKKMEKKVKKNKKAKTHDVKTPNTNTGQKKIDVFDPKYKNEFIKLVKKNNVAISTGKSWKDSGKICGKYLYEKRKFDIHFEIENYPTAKQEQNRIWIGVVDYRNRNLFLSSERGRMAGTYYYQCIWNNFKMDNNKLSSLKYGQINDERVQEDYGKPLKTGDRFTIHLDMIAKTIAFSVNDQNFGIAFKNLPEKVYVFAELRSQKQKHDKNIIKFI
ncbi:spry domain containing socs box protein [Anaeramoeba flamelloides]|uniref:Spry domain containing socs box protein n=1 Tax=Anaeramoeba flamelloides TaxID=1746091 RepID=A0ABQ8XR00_9EUKA|nr:spry domain containing socs box protein [Anaeramoeba flamelloides]